jgi:hypothetical protein
LALDVAGDAVARASREGRPAAVEAATFEAATFEAATFEAATFEAAGAATGAGRDAAAGADAAGARDATVGAGAAAALLAAASASAFARAARARARAVAGPTAETAGEATANFDTDSDGASRVERTAGAASGVDRVDAPPPGDADSGVDSDAGTELATDVDRWATCAAALLASASASALARAARACAKAVAGPTGVAARGGAAPADTDEPAESTGDGATAERPIEPRCEACSRATALARDPDGAGVPEAVFAGDADAGPAPAATAWVSRAATLPSGLVVALASACARAARACAKAVAGPTLETAGEAGAAAAGDVGALVACADAELAGAELAGSVVGATLRRRRMMTVGWTRRISTSPRSARAERALLAPRSGVEALEVVGRWVGFSVGRCTGFIVYATCPFDLASTRASVGDL